MGIIIISLGGGRFVRAMGALILAASLAFVLYEVWEFRHQLADWQPTRRQVSAVAIGIVLYALAVVPLAQGWKYSLRILQGRSADARGLGIIYARSQMGKYVPGNVAHIAGRHIASVADGYTHSSLLLSTLYEFLGILSAAGFVSGVILLFSNVGSLEAFPLINFVPLLALALPVFCLAHRHAPAFLIGRRIPQPDSGASPTRLMVLPYLFYVAFFLLAGGTLVLLTLSFDVELAGLSVMPIWLAFSAGWMLGFLAPGAPSGIGIREAVLVYILSPMIGAPSAIIVAVLFRIVTVVGDMLFWLCNEVLTRCGLLRIRGGGKPSHD